MEDRVDRIGQSFESDSLPSALKDELLLVSSPLPEQLDRSQKGQRKPFSARKAVLCGGCILIVVLGVILGVDYVHTLSGNEKWSFRAQGAISGSPVIANGLVYVNTEPDYPNEDLTFDLPIRDKLYALDEASGATKWSFTTNGMLSPSPVVVNGLVYVSTTIHVSSGLSVGMFYALNARSGRVMWSYPIRSALDFSPVIANGMAYVISQHSSLDALDAFSGSKKWSFLLNIKGDTASIPTVANGTVYIGTNNGKIGPDLKGTLYALDAVSGQMKWSYQANGGLFFFLGATATSVYVSFGEDMLYALDAASGHMKWFQLTEGRVVSAPVVANGTVYAVALLPPDRSTLSALDATSGTVKWSHVATIDSTSSGIAEWSSPLVVNGVVYVTSNADDAIGDNVYAFDAVSGKNIWSDPVEGPTYTLTLVNDTLYISSLNSVVYAFNIISGQKKWSYATKAVIQSSPTVVHGTVYIGTSDGTLYALVA